VLLIGAVLMIRTFAALHAVTPGFDAQNVLTMEMSLTGQRYLKTDGVAQLTRNGRDRLNAIPGVEVAAAGFWLPIHVGDFLPFEIVGKPPVDKDHELGSKWMSITPGYLSVFHIPLLRGRDFNDSDKAGAPGVALINEAFAKRYFPKEDPVGRQITTSKGYGPELEEGTRTIVGVIADTHNMGLGQDAEPMLIAPIVQVTDAYTASYSNVQPLLWAVRTHGDPRAALPAITEQLRLASGGFPVAHARTMEEVMGRSTGRENFNMLLLTIFGVVALSLASIGIYGLMSYTVAQRHQEMGIRMALGADRAAIRRLVVTSGMRLAIAGIALGLAAAFGLTRLMSSFLFEVHPWDPIAFLSAPILLALVTLIAVWLPGMRASKADPVQALRAE
jgi:predicted permease